MRKADVTWAPLLPKTQSHGEPSTYCQGGKATKYVPSNELHDEEIEERLAEVKDIWRKHLVRKDRRCVHTVQELIMAPT